MKASHTTPFFKCAFRRFTFLLLKVKMDDTCSFWGDTPEAECSGPDPSASTFNDWGGSSALGATSSAIGAKPQGGETLCSLENAQDAHSFTDEVDHTMSTKEDAVKDAFPENCEDDDIGTFWVDLCEEISTDTKDHVNLQLNPERYTGYNGSHIWASIYNENCLSTNKAEYRILQYSLFILEYSNVLVM